MSTEQFELEAGRCLLSMLREQAAAILSTLADSPTGKHSFRVSFKLTASKEKIYLSAKLVHSTKSDAEAESVIDVDDPKSPKLPGIGGEE